MNRHPEGPLNERAQSGFHLRAALARKWAERASRTEGPCAFYYMEFYVTKNARSLKATRPLICPSTPKAARMGTRKRGARSRLSGHHLGNELGIQSMVETELKGTASD